MRLATQNAYLTLQSGLAESEDNDSEAPAATGLEQRERARLRARDVRVVKLAGQDRYLARKRSTASWYERAVCRLRVLRPATQAFTVASLGSIITTELGSDVSIESERGVGYRLVAADGIPQEQVPAR